MWSCRIPDAREETGGNDYRNRELAPGPNEFFCYCTVGHALSRLDMRGRHQSCRYDFCILAIFRLFCNTSLFYSFRVASKLPNHAVELSKLILGV
jgi:hypothetical protein